MYTSTWVISSTYVVVYSGVQSQKRRRTVITRPQRHPWSIIRHSHLSLSLFFLSCFHPSLSSLLLFSSHSSSRLFRLFLLLLSSLPPPDSTSQDDSSRLPTSFLPTRSVCPRQSWTGLIGGLRTAYTYLSSILPVFRWLLHTHNKRQIIILVLICQSTLSTLSFCHPFVLLLRRLCDPVSGNQQPVWCAIDLIQRLFNNILKPFFFSSSSFFALTPSQKAPLRLW